MTSQSQNYRRRLVIESDSSDEDSDDDDSSIEVLGTTTPARVAKPPPSSSAAAPPARKRKDSFDSLLSDSSSSLEGYFERAATISNRLLSKPSATIEFPDDGLEQEKDGGVDKENDDYDDNDDDANDDQKEESENLESNAPHLKPAWAQKKRSTDYYFSPEMNSNVSWPDFSLPNELYDQLFNFQRQGVQFLASLHTDGIGGILGDDMGMGKTYVTLAYLGGMMRAGTIRNALVICPVSVLQSWEKEARKILPQCTSFVNITVVSSDSMSRRRRQEIIASIARKQKSSHPKCHLVITSYGLIRSATDDFSYGSKSLWDYAVLDEGHQIKNIAAEVSKACRAVCSPGTRRLLLTGTPILNNLKELWSLFDFATSGEVLGNSKQFTQYYANHIEAARDRLATQSEIELGQRKNKELQGKTSRYFLQRLKIDFLKDKLPEKHDIVVWTHLSEEQRRRYNEYIGGDTVQDILTGSMKSPLEGVTWLKKLCGHPKLVDETNHEYGTREGLLSRSAKLQALESLMVHLKENNHRVLIFSQSTKMLDMIDRVMREQFCMSRIDGSTPGKDRQRLVDEFNSMKSPYDAMLLSTKAAGCGLTLTGADTAIVYDPSWTPAEDAQAVDRCYRIGQTKEVTVYRLITAGTVEEKTYEKQIYKDGIRRTVLSEGQQVERYFERNELRDLFKLGEYGECRVKEKLKTCSVDWKRYKFISTVSGVVGISRHDGFYGAEGGNKNPSVDGSESPARPKIVGKSQRILGRSQLLPNAQYRDVEIIDAPSSMIPMDQDVELVEPLPERDLGRQFSPKTPTSNEDMFVPVHGEIDSTTAKENKNPTQQVSLGDDLDLDDEMIAKMIDAADEHARNGRPRKSLEVLIDLVEPGTPFIDGEQKLAVHRKIASVACDLQLLQSKSSSIA